MDIGYVYISSFKTSPPFFSYRKSKEERTHNGNTKQRTKGILDQYLSRMMDMTISNISTSIMFLSKLNHKCIHLFALAIIYIDLAKKCMFIHWPVPKIRGQYCHHCDIGWWSSVVVVICKDVQSISWPLQRWRSYLANHPEPLFLYMHRSFKKEVGEGSPHKQKKSSVKVEWPIKKTSMFIYFT